MVNAGAEKTVTLTCYDTKFSSYKELAMSCTQIHQKWTQCYFLKVVVECLASVTRTITLKKSVCTSATKIFDLLLLTDG